MNLSKKLFVLSSPSGGGKSTLARHLRELFPILEFSISCTTRKMREGEVEAKDYYFLDKEHFIQKRENNEFAEWEEIFGNYYGTLKSEIEKITQGGHPVLFDVDVKGALSLKNAYPDETVLIFIKPPSETELEKRLRNRRTETEEEISRRLARAKQELEDIEKFDYTIVNDVLENAFAEIKRIGEIYLS